MSRPANQPAASRLQLEYARVRAYSLELVRGLSAEDCQLQSMPDASPLKWHLAHTTWFFETFVLAALPQPPKVVDPSYKVLFNSYYVGVGERHLRAERGLLSRPTWTRYCTTANRSTSTCNRRWPTSPRAAPLQPW
ncbi:DinB family protein [Halopseudomonas pachastrellae]|nr:DinB family protein [Halopseudomonas pachastrellae]